MLVIGTYTDGSKHHPHSRRPAHTTLADRSPAELLRQVSLPLTNA